MPKQATTTTKGRFMIVIDPELYAQLETLAKKAHRDPAQQGAYMLELAIVDVTKALEPRLHLAHPPVDGMHITHVPYVLEDGA